MDNKKYKILVVKDNAENYKIKHYLLFDVPFRLITVAKSESGKTNLLVNLLTRDEFYKKIFKPENIYIFSPSINNDEKLKKMIKYLDIPKNNLFNNYDIDILTSLYEIIQEEYEEAINDKSKPENYLIIMDDLSFSGKLKKSTIINKIYQNGRHINLSVIINSQKLSDLSTNIRENASAAIMYPSSNKQLDLFNDDFNYTQLSKKEFIKVFRKYTPEKYNFVCVNFSNSKNKYLNSDFEPIEEYNNNMIIK